MNAIQVFRAAALVLACSGAHADYTINSFVLPGAEMSNVWGINDNGAFVGTAYTATSQFGYVYDAGLITALTGPAGASGVGALGISNDGVVVGNYYTQDSSGASSIHPFVYQSGSYTLTDLGISGGSNIQVRAISADSHYLTGFYSTAAGNSAGFVYDLRGSSMVGNIDLGLNTTVIAQGVNSLGQVVGSISNSSAGFYGAFLYDLNSGTRTDFTFSGYLQVAARGINDHGQIAGWVSSYDGGQNAWIGTSSGYQLIGPTGSGSWAGEGLNNLGQVVGFQTSSDFGQSPGFIASPSVLPTSTTPGSYSFSAAVVADVPIFIDPEVAVGYVYAIGSGNPLFKTVSLPVGVGDNHYVIVVDGQRFDVAGQEIFDFTAHGFANGVAGFTVEGIEPDAQLDPKDGQAFATRLTFMGSGMFTGTQTAMTQDFSPSVPEPCGAILMLAGLGAGLVRLRRKV